MSGKLILVTGVTGFIAGQVANALLKQGYRVRGTTRGAKVKTLTETIKVPGLEFTQVDDVATSDITAALKGVHAVVHVASPLPGHASADDTLNTAIDGTINILKQVAAAKIEKIVVTSSFGAVLDASLRPGFAGINFTEEHWGETTREEVIAKAADPYFVYFASKILAEKAVWEFAKEHPELDVATILPGFVYGPYADHFPYPAESALGTNGFVNALISGAVPPTIPPFFVDVRDVAIAHVRALDVPRASPSDLQSKRYLVSAVNYTWKEAAEDLRKKGKAGVVVAEAEKFGDLPGKASVLDNTRSKKVLGLEYIAVDKTIDDAAVSLLEAKKTWV